MRYEYIEPFVTSTVRVIDSIIQSDIAKGDISLIRGEEIAGDVAIIIRLEGDSEGSIILNMDTETARKICSVMNDAPFESLTAFGIDSIAELANMIAGNAASVLNDMGFKFDVLPPQVVIKDSMRDKTSCREVFQVPLFTEYGEITMNIAMRTN